MLVNNCLTTDHTFKPGLGISHYMVLCEILMMVPKRNQEVWHIKKQLWLGNTLILTVLIQMFFSIRLFHNDNTSGILEKTLMQIIMALL